MSQVYSITFHNLGAPTAPSTDPRVQAFYRASVPTGSTVTSSGAVRTQAEIQQQAADRRMLTPVNIGLAIGEVALGCFLLARANAATQGKPVGTKLAYFSGAVLAMIVVDRALVAVVQDSR